MGAQIAVEIERSIVNGHPAILLTINGITTTFSPKAAREIGENMFKLASKEEGE